MDGNIADSFGYNLFFCIVWSLPSTDLRFATLNRLAGNLGSCYDDMLPQINPISSCHVAVGKDMQSMQDHDYEHTRNIVPTSSPLTGPKYIARAPIHHVLSQSGLSHLYHL